MNAAKCPYRHDIPTPPPRIAALPVDSRGYPVPFFVVWLDGKPEFRIADPEKIVACIQTKLCWVCGQPLGGYLAFVLGPMCTITRTTSEPPSHKDCAEYSVHACPFLLRPNMVRREDELTTESKGNVAGIMLERNPGVMALWVTRSYTIFRDPKGKPFLSVGDPLQVDWYREGRAATRGEVMESIDSGYPFLTAQCDCPEAFKELSDMRKKAEMYLPL